MTDNLYYIVAGEVIHVVSGKSWCDFVEERIMKPLEMDNSVAFVRLRTQQYNPMCLLTEN
jgi:CubicO group peptidase (beta-lactamase class C family)